MAAAPFPEPAEARRPADITAGHFFAGVIGVSILRNWYLDGAFNERRLAELRNLANSTEEFPYSLALNPAERDLQSGYREWAANYDGPNPLIAAEEPSVRPLLDRYAGAGKRALDAACGTGRHAAYLVGRGCVTTGVDQSAAMLTVARAKAPGATFVEADVRATGLPSDEFDLAVISLALCHLPDPTTALIELARILRPGATLIITDPHPDSATAGGQAFYGGITPGQPMTWVRNNYHRASVWLAGFRAAGLRVDECHEVPIDEAGIAANPAALFVPEAVHAAFAGLIAFWVWVVTKPAT